MISRLDRFPEFHIDHYSPYKPATLKRLMGPSLLAKTTSTGCSGVRDSWTFWQSCDGVCARASVESYSIKELEIFYGFQRPVELQLANRLRFALQHALELDRLDQISQEMRDAVEGYNRDDCVSTLRLRDWLESLRAEHAARGVKVPRPEVSGGEPTEELSEDRKKVRHLMDRLLDGVPLQREERSPQQQAVWLLAQMLEWHRREDKSVWWEYFRLRDLTDEEMLDTRGAIAGLQFVKRVETIKRSVVDCYAYPSQEVSIQRDDKVKTSLIDGGLFGVVVDIDSTASQIQIKKGPSRADLHPRTLFAHDHIPAEVLRDSLLRFASWVAERGIEVEGSWRAGRDLLLGLRPRRREGSVGPLRKQAETALKASRRLVLELEKVGVTAVSHKVIRHLLEESCKVAREEGLALHCVQKVGKVRDPDHGSIEEVTSNSAAAQAMKVGEVSVFAGTAWLWARPELAEGLDVLFVDEAGQMSLSNVLAVSSAARNLVLLGDPQQLEQPQQGSHPEGTDLSALEHILAGHKTMPERQGLFLEKTYRLHPHICRFTSEQFYEGRLEPHLGLERQMILDGSAIQGSGLWYLPLGHEGNVNSSREEVEAIQALVDSLVLGPGPEPLESQRPKNSYHFSKKLVSVLLEQFGSCVQFSPTESSGSLQRHWIKPELGNHRFTPDVDVWRLTSI